jgi:hypothetical protein
VMMMPSVATANLDDAVLPNESPPVVPVAEICVAAGLKPVVIVNRSPDVDVSVVWTQNIYFRRRCLIHDSIGGENIVSPFQKADREHLPFPIQFKLCIDKPLKRAIAPHYGYERDQ